MPNYELHVIAGHVGRDVRLAYTQTGVAVADFSVAVNNPFKKDDPPTWYKVTCWRATAEFVNSYVTKGAAVLVEGDQLALEEWTAQDGTVRHTLVLQARRVQLLSGRGESVENGAPTEAEEMPF